MRASIVIAASLIGLVAGAACARAADLAVEPDDGGYDVCCGVAYDPVPQVVIYDDDPGVVVRRWWLPPWRNRHYYPHGRAPLKSGISHPGERSRAAPRSGPRYVRYWTNPQADVTPLIDPEYVPLPPRRYPYRPPPPVAAP